MKSVSSLIQHARMRSQIKVSPSNEVNIMLGNIAISLLFSMAVAVLWLRGGYVNSPHKYF
ncbi:hypothetical protein BofuT4_uP035610.1 [Botrytis cinerea T4]|uniref:Uncharacterized protein n=1 Tax=Botryotinia fuckeliana (strain T4) TaxID=999810 RepID=G2Y4J1_BOTF4|nr:hypothetical protein BofuT4_uP035610.1 [Botrytis cinerea T4]